MTLTYTFPHFVSTNMYARRVFGYDGLFRKTHSNPMEDKTDHKVGSIGLLSLTLTNQAMMCLVYSILLLKSCILPVRVFPRNSCPNVSRL
jgi:hypothetical protein